MFEFLHKMKDKIIYTTSAKLQNQFAACGLKASRMNLCIKTYIYIYIYIYIYVYEEDGKLQE